jgi:hypothetical protein
MPRQEEYPPPMPMPGPKAKTLPVKRATKTIELIRVIDFFIITSIWVDWLLDLYDHCLELIDSKGCAMGLKYL